MMPVNITYPFKDCGLFGAKRKYDIHTGIDMYCEEGSEVVSIQEGIVLEVIQFTGEGVGSPWWNNTYAVVVFNEDFTLVYGEIAPCVEAGQIVHKGDKLGNVLPVLKEDKGVTPTSMLHLEAWISGRYISNFTHNHGVATPLGLIDPTLVLDPGDKSIDFWIVKTECGYKVEDAFGSYLRIFNMAADAKAFAIGGKSCYLSKSSPVEDKVAYTIYTGKSLWFDN